jgi:hypothetical protein
MPLADCFAAALAGMKKAAIYTGGPEFKAIEADEELVMGIGALCPG